jgi:hypothetical protein
MDEGIPLPFVVEIVRDRNLLATSIPQRGWRP